MSKTLFDLAFTEIVPPSITGDIKILGLADGTGEALKNVQTDIQSVYILSRIGELPEPVVDLLGWQFHVDFWDENLALDRKRELVKGSIAAHKMKGAPAAIESVLAAIGLQATVREWYEYSGSPYYFRVEIGSSTEEITPELAEKIIRLINHYKNTRSWLDELIVFYLSLGEVHMAAGCVAAAAAWAPFDNLYETDSEGMLCAAAGCVAHVTAYAPFWS